MAEFDIIIYGATGIYGAAWSREYINATYPDSSLGHWPVCSASKLASVRDEGWALALRYALDEGRFASDPRR